MHKVKVHKVGLAVGGAMALAHAGWAVLVWWGTAKSLFDWILGLHFMSFQYAMTAFSFGRAVTLVIVTGVIGYIMGAVLGWFWNFLHH